MDIGISISAIRTAIAGVQTLNKLRSLLKIPKITFFFGVGEGYGYSTPLSRKHFLAELHTFDRAGRWLEINIEISNDTMQDMNIQGLAIHAGKSKSPLKNLTFGGKVLPLRMLTNQTDHWTVSLKELTQALTVFPTDYESWPELNLFVKLGNGKTVRACPGISRKEWAAVVSAWKDPLA